MNVRDFLYKRRSIRKRIRQLFGTLDDRLYNRITPSEIDQAIDYVKTHPKDIPILISVLTHTLTTECVNVRHETPMVVQSPAEKNVAILTPSLFQFTVEYGNYDLWHHLVACMCVTLSTSIDEHGEQCGLTIAILTRDTQSILIKELMYACQNIRSDTWTAFFHVVFESSHGQVLHTVFYHLIDELLGRAPFQSRVLVVMDEDNITKTLCRNGKVLYDILFAPYRMRLPKVHAGAKLDIYRRTSRQNARQRFHYQVPADRWRKTLHRDDVDTISEYLFSLPFRERIQFIRHFRRSQSIWRQKKLPAVQDSYFT